MAVNRYFGFHSRSGWVEMVPPQRPDGMPPDMDYWSRTFVEIERIAPDLGLRFVATWDWRQIEIEGPDVVAVNLGAEPPYRPLWAKKVLATFRSVAWKPRETVSGLTRLDMMAVSGAMKLAYNSLRHFVGEWGLEGPLPGHCFDVPLGVYKWEETKSKPIVEREIDLVFLGSIDVKNDVGSWRNLFAPKTTGRNDMVRAIERLQKARPDLKLQIGFAEHFGADVPGMAQGYTETLANSKLGLHPVGRNPESFRFFELVRAGCVPVSHFLPNRPFYQGNPAVFMDRFDQLEAEIDALLGDPEALQRRSDACVEYWNRMVSPEAIARMMVGKIRSLV